MDLGKLLRSGRMPCRLDSRGMMRHTSKTLWLSYVGMPIILAVIGLGRHSCRRTHALVQPAKCRRMAAVTVVLDHPVRSLPLVREVRGDERLPQ
jgi:hypothetical protein